MPSERVQRHIDRLLDEADAAVAERAWALALDRAREALALDPESGDARELAAAAQRLLTASEPGASAPATEPPAAKTPPLPSSFASGRYQVLKFLGEGGRKRVYLAHDNRLDRDVAIAVIKTEGLDVAGLARVRNEAQAMARLGDYPNVVTVFDVGEEQDGQPYMVSQYMAGGSVEDLIAKADDHRVPVEQAVRIGVEVCQGLEQAHRRGIVHRDLKPGNIWLTEDRVACVGDFGLAVALDRSRLTAEGSFVGTALYMAPEQALGQTPEPKSDLYSLGCVLYEMVTGRPPFVGGDTVAVVTQHLNTPPVAPSWHRHDCPTGLEALILRLLEKDAGKRPRGAAEVRTALAALDLQASEAKPDVAATFRSPGGGAGPDVPAIADPVYRQTFVGREPELTQMKSAFDNALSGQGGLVMVVGEPGIGKTAVCEQLSTYVAMRGGRALHGNCYEEGSLSLPYLPFVEAMRSYVLSREPEALKSDLGSNAGYVARIVSEVRDRLAVEVASSGNPEDDRWRLLQAVTDFLRNAAAVQPLMLLIEDLHWSDRGTLDLLLYLARNLAGARLLVVGTYRDVEVDRTHPLSNALADLRRIGNFARVPLRGLGAEDVQKMMANIANRDIPWQLAEQVHRQTEGHPLFVQEVMRYLVEAGIVARDESGRLQRRGDTPLAMQIPEGLRDVIGKRISRLSPDCNRALAVAAVIGREFSFETLTAVAGLSEDALLAAIEEAMKVGVLQEQQQSGAVQYRFAHAFFRQTLYEEMIAPRRIRLHQQVARALEAQYPGRLDEHAAELAEHFSYSSDRADLAKAVAYGRRAAARASAVYSFGEAVGLLEKALQVQEVLDPADERAGLDLLLDLCDALHGADEPSRVDIEVAEEAFQIAERLGERDKATRACLAGLDALAFVSGNPGLQSARANVWWERAERSVVPGTAAGIRVRAGGTGRRGLGPAYVAAEQQAALDDARTLGNANAFHFVAGLVLFNPSHDWESVQRPLMEELAARQGDGAGVRWRAFSGNSSALAWLGQGEREGAEAIFHDLIELRAKAPESVVVASALTAEAVMAGLDGRLEDAVDAARRLPGETGAINVRTRVTYPLFMLGRVADYFAMKPTSGPWEAYTFALAGRADEARTVLEGLNLAAQGGAVGIMVLAGAVLLADRERARALARRAVDTWRPAPTTWPTITDRHLGEAYAFLGETEEARRRFESALELGLKMRWRPEVALARFGLAQLLLEHYPLERKEALAHLDFALAEFREMKMAPYVEKALRLKMEAQGVAGLDVHTSIDRVQAAVQAERPDISLHAAPDGSVTIMFSDIEDSTAINERLGDQPWLDLLREHNALIRKQIAAHGGFEVKTIGDAFMVAFQDPRRAVECAVAIQRAFAGPQAPVLRPFDPAQGNQAQDGQTDALVVHPEFIEGRTASENQIRVRIGLHTGEAIRDKDDFFGRNVTLAHRITDKGVGGQVLVSDRLRQVLRRVRGLRFDNGVEVELKGLAGKHRVFEVIFA